MFDQPGIQVSCTHIELLVPEAVGELAETVKTLEINPSNFINQHGHYTGPLQSSECDEQCVPREWD
jgi:hypothetical protein